MTTNFVGRRLAQFNVAGSAPLVTDVRLIECFWPRLLAPTAIFAPGSSGIKVMGRAAANVQFPPDTVFLPTKPDAVQAAEAAVLAAAGGPVRMVNLSPALSAVWVQAYATAAAALPNTATSIPYNKQCHFTTAVQQVTQNVDITVTEDVTLLDGRVINATYTKTVQQTGPQQVFTQVPATFSDGSLV